MRARDRDAGHPPGAAGDPGGQASAAADLERLRSEIERVDDDVVHLLARRARLAREAARAKRMLGMPTLDPAREAGVVRRAAALARESGLPDDPVRSIFWQVVELCRRVQTEDP